nr:MAG TPA: hypothetical protein [Caudoviricetes sp.]
MPRFESLSAFIRKQKLAIILNLLTEKQKRFLRNVDSNLSHAELAG